MPSSPPAARPAPEPRPRTRVICVAALPMSAREALVDRMMAIDAEVFRDTTPAKTREVLLGRRDEEVWVMTLESGDRLIGYNSVRINHYSVNGRRIAAWGSRAAVLSDFRGRNRTASLPIILYRRYRLRHPLRPIYGLIGLVHPSSFKLFADAMPRMFPFPRLHLDAGARALFDSLCAQMGYRPVPGRDAFLFQQTAWTETGELEARYWAHHSHPGVAWFTRHNPDYRRGQSVVSFFPIDLRLFLEMALRRSGLLPALRRLRLTIDPAARRRDRIALLKAAFPDLPPDDAALLRIADRLQERRLAPDEILIEAGRQQRSIYFLTDGALLVYLPGAEGASPVDQLGPGAVVGEIGALMGIPATATVRSRGRSTVLRMAPELTASLPSQMPALFEHLERLRDDRLDVNESLRRRP